MSPCPAVGCRRESGARAGAGAPCGSTQCHRIARRQRALTEGSSLQPHHGQDHQSPELLDPSLCCSGKRPQSGWRSKSEHCPHTVIGTLWEQRRATVTAQHTDLTLMDRQMDTALAVYLGLARCRAAGGPGGACSGALLIGLRAVQPVLRDGARVGGLHQIHALGAQVDAVILVPYEEVDAL